MKVSRQTYSQNSFILLCFFITGLFFSNAILSISTLLFFVWIIINNYPAITFKNLNNQQKGLLIFFLVYFIWSFWRIENFESTINIIISKLSILGLVITIPFISFTEKQLKQILIIIIIITLGITFYDLWLYFSDTESWKLAYTKGQVLPTFLHHVKFSFVVICSIIILYTYNKKHNKISYFIISYLIIYLHFLSVKSGLLLLYISFFILIMQKIIAKKYVYLLVFLLPVFLFKISTNLQNKIGYLKYDLAQLHQKNVLDYSDARRIISYQAAWNIFKENKLLGTGLTKLKKETENYYKKKYHYFDAEKMMYIHNSYLHILAGTGIVGFTLFLLALFLILYYHWQINKLFFYLNTLFFIICLWDSLTEQLTGLSLFILLQIWHIKNNNDKNL